MTFLPAAKPTALTASTSSLHIGQVRVELMSLRQAVEEIVSTARLRRSLLVFTMNTQHLALLEADPHFAEAYSKAGLVLPDGWPILAMARIQGKRGQGRVTGADLLPRIAARADAGLRIGISGAGPGVAELAASALRQANANLEIVAQAPPIGFEFSPFEVSRVQELAKQVDVLFLAYGSPKQEIFAARYLAGTPCVIIGCGAAVDFVAGVQRRASRIWQFLGLEWLRRLMKDPGRLSGRYRAAGIAFVRYGIPMAFRDRERLVP
ncbi:MAG: hypothetical protein JWL77_7040 [Chthonomonadaceae bacterium]|nr:hypothetical protein [Chthonomonadaceae bacterium]